MTQSNGIYAIIFIAVIIFICIAYKNSSKPEKTIERFNPYLDYPRAYPSTFALNRDYMPYSKSFYMFPDGGNILNPTYMFPNPSLFFPDTNSFKVGNQGNYPRNLRYNAGYGDYAYIPKHEYLKNWMGVPDQVGPIRPVCVVPTSTSEYCVNRHMREDGNLNSAIRACTVPASISESCGLY
jgi:hypothetical protein